MSKDGKYGYLDEEGKERIPCIFDRLGNFSEGLVVAKKDSNFYYYNSRGEVVLDLGARYGDCGTFHDSLAVVLGDNSKTFHDPVHFKNGFDIRYIDHAGKEVLKLNEELRIWTDSPASLNFHDGMLALSGYAGIEYTSARIYLGFLDKKGDLKIPFLFHNHHEAWQVFSEGLAGASIYKDHNMQRTYRAYGEGGYGYINKEGQWVIPPKYHFVRPFQYGAAMVEMSFGQKSRFIQLIGAEYFYTNKKGHRIFADSIYAGFQLRKDSIIGVYIEKTEKKYALAKTNGEFITGFEFQHLHRGDLWGVVKDG
ncbi:MAG: WG repeat-containing protein, partial [Bacteroidota bacterium]